MLNKQCSQHVWLESEELSGTPILCVLGILANEIGIEIADEMMQWLANRYDVVKVYQEYPGKLFEYPALRFAQMASIQFDRPVLYVHTKGAFNHSNVYMQAACRELWKHEFDTNYHWYLDIVKRYSTSVACPFIGDKVHTTWLNGFIATPNAWKSIPTVLPLKDRFPYEHLFAHANVNAFGRILGNVNCFPSEAALMLELINTRQFLKF